jgi:hypothetical protein
VAPHEVTQLASQPQRPDDHIKPAPSAQRSAIDEITLYYFPIVYGTAIVLAFAARGIRGLIENWRGMITVSYPDRKVRVPKGLSILETSLRRRLKSDRGIAETKTDCHLSLRR